jgi:hypothetical protein
LLGETTSHRTNQWLSCFYQFGRRLAVCQRGTYEIKRVSRNSLVANNRLGQAAGAGLAKVGLHRLHGGAGAGLLGELWTDQFYLLL